MVNRTVRSFLGNSQSSSVFNQALQQRDQRERDAVRQERDALLEAERQREEREDAARAGRLQTFTRDVEARMLRQYGGDSSVLRGHDSRDLRVSEAQRALLEVMRERGVNIPLSERQQFREELVEPLLEHFSGSNWIPDADLFGGPAFQNPHVLAVIDNFNQGQSPALESLRADPLAARSASDSGDDDGDGGSWLDPVTDVLSSITSAIAQGTGGAAQFIGDTANDLYDSYQQEQAISREVARMRAEARERGEFIMPRMGGDPAGEAARAAERRRAEQNIQAELAALDTAPTNFLSRFGAAQLAQADRFSEATLSDAALQEDADYEAAEGVGGKLGVLIRSPVRRTSQMAGFLLGSGGVAGGSRAAAATTLGRLGRVGAAQALNSTVARNVVAVSGISAGSAGEISDQTRSYIEDLSDDDLMSLPITEDALEVLGADASVAEVRTLVSETLARRARSIGFAAGAAGVFIGGRTEFLAQQAARAVVSRSLAPLGAGTGRGIVTASARELAGEAVEEGGQELASQVGRDQALDVGDIGTAAGVGAVIGGVVGGGLRAVGNVGRRGQPDPDTDSDTGSDTDSDTDSGVTDPETDPEIDEDTNTALLEEESTVLAEDNELAEVAQADPDVAAAVADPVGLFEELRTARAQLRQDMEAEAAREAERVTRDGLRFEGRLNPGVARTAAERVQLEQATAFDAVLTADNTIVGTFMPAAQHMLATHKELTAVGRTRTHDAASESAVAARDPLARYPADIRSAQSRADARAAARAETADLLPPAAQETLERLRKKSYRLIQNIAPQFNPRDVEARNLAIYGRLIERGLSPNDANAFAEVVAPIPRSEIDVGLETAVELNPELTRAAGLYKADLDAYRTVQRFRNRVSRLLTAQATGEGKTLDRALANQKFEASYEAIAQQMREAGLDVPGVAEIEASAQLRDLDFGVQRIAHVDAGGTELALSPEPTAGLQRAANVAPTVREVARNIIHKPLSVDNVPDAGRAIAAIIPRTLYSWDSTDAFRVLSQAASKKAKRIINPHSAYTAAQGRIANNEELIDERVVRPIRGVLTDMAVENGMDEATARTHAKDYLLARTILERIPVLHIQNYTALKQQKLREVTDLDLELRNGTRAVTEIRQELEAIFDDPANYKDPKKFVVREDRTYQEGDRQWTMQAARDHLEAVARSSYAEYLHQVGEFADRGAQMARDWYAEGNVGGVPLQRILQMYDMQHYVPVLATQDQAVTYFDTDQVNVRNSGRKRMNDLNGRDIKDPLEQMYVSMSRASIKSAEARFFTDLAAAVEAVDNAGLGTVERNIPMQLNPKTGRHFHDKMPTAVESNKFVSHNADGTIDVITLNQSEYVDLLTDRYAPQEKPGPVKAGLARATRFFGRTLTTYNPAFVYGTSMWRSMQDTFLQTTASSGKGDLDVPGNAAVAWTQIGNVLKAGLHGFPVPGGGLVLPRTTMQKFYSSTADTQVRMAAEFEASDNPILQAAAARFNQLGVGTFRQSLQQRGLFERNVQSGDPLTRPSLAGRALGVAKNGVQYLNRQLDGAVTSMDNMFRNAAVATLVQHGVPQREAIDQVENMMNFNIRAGGKASKLGTYFAFANTAMVGANTAATRRLFKGGEHPVVTTVNADGVEVVSTDWARVPSEINWPQAMALLSVGATGTGLSVLAMGVETDENGDERPLAAKIPAIRFMTNTLLPEVLDENGIPEPTAIPSEYGIQMLMQGAASGAALYMAGTHDLDDIAGAYGEIMLSVFSPFGRADPTAVAGSEGVDQIKQLANMFTPTALLPVVQGVINNSSFNSVLFTPDGATRDSLLEEPRVDEVTGQPTPFRNTEDLFVEAAGAASGIGMLESMNLDSPEVVKHWARSYGGFPVRFFLQLNREAARKLEDPTYEANDEFRNFPGTPFRSVNDARHFTQRATQEVLDDRYFPMQDEYRAAIRAAEAGDRAPLLQFNRLYPQYRRAAAIAQTYFDDSRRLGELRDVEEERPIDGFSYERRKELRLQQEAQRETFLRRWFEIFPDTDPEV